MTLLGDWLDGCPFLEFNPNLRELPSFRLNVFEVYSTITFMQKRPSVYVVLSLIFIGSALIASVVPANGVLQAISAVPALGALFAALFQVFRDQAAFERQLLLQQQQQAFSLGSASHMASKAFDKHAEFCEKYMEEVHLTVGTLFREGPTEKALEHAAKLVRLKSQYSAWLTKAILDGLVPFEAALRSIGAKKGLVTALSGTDDPTRPIAIKEMYEVFKEVMNLGEPKEVPKDGRADLTIEAVEEQLRAILGIEQLTAIRQRLIEQALAARTA